MPAGPVLADVSSTEMAAAMSTSTIPLVVWDEPTLTILLVNAPAADLAGLTTAALTGRHATDLLCDPEPAEHAADALRSGALDAFTATRRLRRGDGRCIEALVWTRTVRVDSTPCGLTLAVPDGELARLGRDPNRAWRDLAAIAVGSLDEARRITSVSAEICRILGGKPSDWIGLPLIRLVTESQVQTVLDVISHEPIPATSLSDIGLRHRNGSSVRGSLLIAQNSGASKEFAFFSVIGADGGDGAGSSSRVAELERRLQRIGAEVRAARVLEVMPHRSCVDSAENPQLAELSTRQWEVLGRIARGQSTPDIAAELFVSPSTVRNHLTAIYRKFGVHSQAALLSRLRRHPLRL